MGSIATLTRLNGEEHGVVSQCFPEGCPNIPVWLGETDDSVSRSWENGATARTSQGQGLVSVHAELLRRAEAHTMCHHLAGALNLVADDISRNDYSLSFSIRTQQLFLKHPCLASLDYFQPSLDCSFLCLGCSQGTIRFPAFCHQPWDSFYPPAPPLPFLLPCEVGRQPLVGGGLGGPQGPGAVAVGHVCCPFGLRALHSLQANPFCNS